MRRTASALCAGVGLLFAAAASFGSFGQDSSAEARRHFEAGVAAVKAAGSKAGYQPALREFEESVRLAPGWPGAVRALGMVLRAAGRYADAEASFRRYLALAPRAADAGRIGDLIGEMAELRDLDAGAARILEGMASGTTSRKHVRSEETEGWLGWPGPLERFRTSAGATQVENAWYPGDRYHPNAHPPIARQWEPVKVDGRFYEYAYSHYMDAAPGYVVRYDYVVRGEVVSLKPPRLEETVYWSVTWGAPTAADVPPWTAENDYGGCQVSLVELVRAADVRDANGRTKLHLAAMQGRRAEAAELIAAGADVNARDNGGGTPLHAAAGFGQRTVIDLLLTMNADLEARNDAGDTPLYAAAYWGRVDVALLLIEFGADLNARNKEGLTPLMAAEKMNHAEMAALLRSRGAK